MKSRVKGMIVGLMALSLVGVSTLSAETATTAVIKSLGLTPLEARPAPNFTLTDLSGKTVKLSDLKGKVVILNFWATWCPPCRAEMPSLQALYQANKTSDLVILTVDIQEEAPAVSAFIKRLAYGFGVVLDTSGDVAGQYGIQSIPATFIINQQGSVIGSKIGAHDWGSSTVQKGIAQLLAKK